MWGIYDLQREELRSEVYENREQAICEFADYWRNICYFDYFDSYDFPEFLTEEEKDEIVWNDIKILMMKHLSPNIMALSL